jgi:hypothetical protein
MSKMFIAVVLATSMIASSAFAATQSNNVTTTHASAHVKHAGKHAQKHVVHKAHLAKVTKGTKVGKTKHIHSASLARHLTKTN